jgi:predicted Rossmann-fold nucleotide-binding protein
VLTLVQTRVGRHIPIILVDSAFWRGLLDWMRDSLLDNGLISAEDLRLITVVDEPAQVVEAIFDFYQSRGFGPTARENERLLSL